MAISYKESEKVAKQLLKAMEPDEAKTLLRSLRRVVHNKSFRGTIEKVEMYLNQQIRNEA